MPNLVIRKLCRRRLILRKFFQHPYQSVLVVVNLSLITVLLWLHVDEGRRPSAATRGSLSSDARRRYKLLLKESFVDFQFMQNNQNNRKSNERQSNDDDLSGSTVPVVGCFRVRWRSSPPSQEMSPGRELQWQVLRTGRNEVFFFSAYFDDRPTDEFSNLWFAVRLLAMARKKITGQLYCQIFSPDGQSVAVAKAFVSEIWARRFDPRQDFYQPFLITCPVAKVDGSNGKPRRNRRAFVQEQHQRQQTVQWPWFMVSVNDVPCSTSSTVALKVHIPKTRVEVRNQHLDQNNSTPVPMADVVVCVKGLNFVADYSLRLVEWIEATLLMGADRILLYSYALHDNMKRTLKFYETRGRIVHVPISLPGNMPNWPWARSRFIDRNRSQKRRLELIPYNDCLYRHLYSHRYALLVDVDELIVPRYHRNWSEMLQDVVQHGSTSEWPPDSFSGIAVSNAFFFDDLTAEVNVRADAWVLVNTDSALSNPPSYMHMLRHSRRSAAISERGFYCKTFMVINNVKTVFNHFPLDKLRGKSRPTFYIEPEVAVKHHYKETCPYELRQQCPELFNKTVFDDGLLRFAPQLVARVSEVVSLLRLNLLPT